VTKRLPRLLQLAGILIAVIGLAGYWLSFDVQRSEMSDVTRQVLNVPENVRPISFVLAGRDKNPVRNAGANRIVNGKCVLSEAGEFVTSARTDTIMFMTIIGNEISLINLPRDIYVAGHDSKLNAVRAYGGAAGLKDAVAEILDVPVDFYMIVNMELFERFIDELGGIDITVPYRMKYQDCADGLEIDFEPGPKHMDGADASRFVRFRNTALSDVDRLDNVKRLSYAILARLKELNVRAVTRLPALIDTFFSEVETNVSAGLLYELLPRLPHLQITRSASLPNCCTRRMNVRGEQSEVVGYDSREVTEFLARLFSGTAPEVTELPSTPLLITDRSGIPGLGERFRLRLVAMGFPEDNLTAQELEAESGPSRILATSKHGEHAQAYAELFGLPLQELARLVNTDGSGIELVLTREAAMLPIAARLAAGTHAPCRPDQAADCSPAVPPESEPAAD
jgi:LCP family protein required for cell wall assembly